MTKLRTAMAGQQPPARIAITIDCSMQQTNDDMHWHKGFRLSGRSARCRV